MRRRGRNTIIGAAVAAALALALIAAGGALLYQDLNQTKADLQATEAARADTFNQLVQERTDRNRLQVQSTALAASLQDAEADNAALTTSLQDAEANNKSLRAQRNRLESSYSDLVNKIGSLDALNTQVESLQTQIHDLEEQRRALILNPGDLETTHFACTGSMEPKLTCLDEGTLVKPTHPSDIILGATISFASKACWPDDTSNSYTLHRVIDIRVDNGTTYYWPKGDNVPEPDGCWIPFTAVKSYLTALRKNAYPENAKLRNSVNGAQRSYDAALAAYDREFDRYINVRVRYGCSADPDQDCTASGHAYNQLIAAFDDLDYAWRVVKEAARYYTCWLGVASRSAPGFIAGFCVSLPVALPPLRLPAF